MAPKAKARAKQRTAKTKAKPKAKTAAKVRPKRQRTVRAKAKPRPTSSFESTPSDTSSSSETTTSGYAEVFWERVQTSSRSMDLDSDTILDLEVQLDMSDRLQVPPAPPPAPLPWQREVAILAPSRDDDDGRQRLHIPRMARAGRAAAKDALQGYGFKACELAHPGRWQGSGPTLDLCKSRENLICVRGSVFCRRARC